MGDMQQEQLKDIVKPHAHDVLSGRGNFVNHHSGNENFRKLVKHHKTAYVACPKAQKAIYSKIIYDEIRAMSPPGRFLKQDPKTKLWSDIGEKKALDKTRQALREGAPELLKELETTGEVSGGVGGGNMMNGGGEDFVAPLRAQRNHQFGDSIMGNISLGSFSLGSMGPGASFISNFGSFTTGNPGNSFTTNMGNSFTTNPGNSFTTGGGMQASFSGLSQVGGGGGFDDSDNNLYGQQGANNILAAAAQLQAQQNARQGQNNVELQLLKAQLAMQQQQQAQRQQQQAQQQLGNDQGQAQQNALQGQNNVELQLLKAQLAMQQQQQAQRQQQQAQQQMGNDQGNINNMGNSNSTGNGMANAQNAQFNSMLAAAQASNNGNLPPMGSNEMSNILAAIHNSASGLNNAPGDGGPMNNVVANNPQYQQQLAQLAMFNQMNGMGDSNNHSLNNMGDSSTTLNTSNLGDGGQHQQHMNNNQHTFGSTAQENMTTSFGSISSQATQQHANQQHFGQQQQHQNQPQDQLQSNNQQSQNQFHGGGYQEQITDTSIPLKEESNSGGYQEQTFNISVPLKEEGESTPSPPQRRPGNMRGNQGTGLNSSLTRAQRIGLKNSFTRRPNRRLQNNAELHNSLKNSLMSIESLTLDDIDASIGTNMEGVFDSASETTEHQKAIGGSGGEKKVAEHGDGPHDMSEVSELGFEETKSS